MANRLNVTELDFDQIKSNLKTFLKSQSEFTDYDFEGAGLNVLLDILAYNTHYNAYYLNMIANESFMDTSLLRNSVVSHAKRYGYVPRSSAASQATINLTVDSGNSNPGSLTIPSGYSFVSNLVDNKVYSFVTLSDVTVAKTANNYVFNNIKIYEGKLLSYEYEQSDLSNPKQIFTIPDSDIDTSTLKVSVRQNSSNTYSTLYSLATDSISQNSDSEIYYMQEGMEGKYQIYFGDGVLGKKIPDGGIVKLTYLATSGAEANKANNFVATSPIAGQTNLSVDTISGGSGGAYRETVDQIKFSAPLQFVSQNRAVTKNDYIRLIQQKYPSFDAVNVWGGEENVPPVYGKVFISAKPKLGFEVTDTEREYFLNKIVKPISVMTVTPEFVDTDYNFLKIISNVYYDPTKTALSTASLETKVRNAIVDFCLSNLNQFNTTFRSSKLKSGVDNCDVSVNSNELEIFLSKKFRPNLVTTNTYVLDYGVELSRGTTLDNFYSSPSFTVLDENLISRECFLEEVPSSFTGVESISIITPGNNYTSTPTVEIVGDGSGATAVALVVNGKVDTIKVLSPGVGYTTATVRITGGGGTGATAETILEHRYGQLRISYFKPDEVTNRSTKVVLNSSVNNGVTGSIDYKLGVITINNFNPIDIKNDFKELSVNVRPKSTVIQSIKNKMLAFDESDPTSVVLQLTTV